MKHKSTFPFILCGSTHYIEILSQDDRVLDFPLHFLPYTGTDRQRLEFDCSGLLCEQLWLLPLSFFFLLNATGYRHETVAVWHIEDSFKDLH